VDPLLFKVPKKHSVIHPILKMKKGEGRTTADQQMTTVSEIRNVDVHKFYPVRYICNSRWLFWQPSTSICLISLSKRSSTRGFCRFEQLLNTFPKSLENLVKLGATSWWIWFESHNNWMDIWTGLHRVKIWNVIGWDICMEIIRPLPLDREINRT
jgi:hypothetical protein